jgi:hypothetical protein
VVVGGGGESDPPVDRDMSDRIDMSSLRVSLYCRMFALRLDAEESVRKRLQVSLSHRSSPLTNITSLLVIRLNLHIQVSGNQH